MDRLVCFLTGERGLSLLTKVIEAGHEVISVIVPYGHSNMDKIRSECKKLKMNMIAVRDANSSGFIEKMRAMRPQLFIVAGYPTIFSEDLMKAAPRGVINLHGGPLPRYRGGSPLNWQIIRGEARVGISVIQLDEGIDTGAILAEGETEINSIDTISDIHEWANEVFPRLVLKVLHQFDCGECQGRIQDESEAEYWHQRTDEDGQIDWRNNTAREIHNLVRGVTRPYPGAFTYYEGTRVRIFRTELTQSVLRGVAGRICFLQGRGPYVMCSDRGLLLKDFETDLGCNITLRHASRFETS